MENLKRPFALIIAVLAGFAVIAQFYINLSTGEEPQLHIILRFFAYFTILSNLMVTGHFAVQAMKSVPPRFDRYVSPGASTILTTYITIVGIVYYTMLRNNWDPQGLQLWVDRLLHMVVPILSILFWVILTPKGSLSWKLIGRLLIIPFLYFVYVLLLGEAIGKYPYPFFRVTEHGYVQVLITALVLLGCQALVGAIYVGFGKFMARR